MKFKLFFIAATLLVSASCNGQKKGDKANVNMKTQVDSVSYGIGVAIGENLKRDKLDSINVDIMAKGIRDVLRGDSTAITQEQANQIISTYLEGMKAQQAVASQATARKFLEDNKKKQGVTETPSGLQYEIITMGTGSKPLATDTVVTHYHGTLTNGEIFDSSVQRGEPVSFPVNQVIPGWTEALQMMPVGSKWKLVIPSNLAYGEQGAGGVIGPNETLIFEVESPMADTARTLPA
jgi:FKBP-type peptidyl-prolyl cis-trans isomerase FklB